MTDKKGDSIPLKFWNGLEDEIKELADIEGRNFTEMVNHLCDRGLYHSRYKFPAHKQKCRPIFEESEEKKGRTS